MAECVDAIALLPVRIEDSLSKKNSNKINSPIPDAFVYFSQRSALPCRTFDIVLNDSLSNRVSFVVLRRRN